MSRRYLGIDQYGSTYGLHEGGLKYPRIELMRILDRTKAELMYVTGEDGSTYHIGYVIAGYWITLYEITPMRRKVD